MSSKKSITSRIYNFLFVFIVGLILCAPAFQNGFPLLYQDSASYIMNSHYLVTPASRPVVYGLLIRAVAWESTVWTVIVVQGMMAVFLLLQLVDLFIGGKRKCELTLLLSLFLMLFSSMAWYSCQIMPDIFTAYMVLSIFLLVVNKNNTKLNTLLNYMILGLSIGVHYSHFVILPIMLVLIGLFALKLNNWKWSFGNKIIQQIAKIAVTWFIVLQFVLIYNFYSVGHYGLSQSTYIFLTGKLCETGVIDMYLKDNCGKKDIPLCAYKNKIPNATWKFVWDQNSPYVLSKMSLEEGNEAYGKIVKDIVLTPRYWRFIIWTGIKDTLRQLAKNEIGSGLFPYLKGSGPYIVVSEYLGKDELNEYTHSFQKNDRLDFTLLNHINNILLVASLFFIFINFNRDIFSEKMKYMAFVFLTGVLVNAFITANLANVSERLQSRVSWLVIVLGIFCAVNFYQSLRKNKEEIKEL